MTDTESVATIISADSIADALGEHRPTAQQRAVIESPLEPALVVAGAGSGKTHTMAFRVLWLLANRLVEPSQILGLTFTRKAAGELGTRIGESIAALHATGMLGENPDPFEKPTVATYNSYANALYRENSIVLGREADGAVLGDAAAWQLARTTALRSRHPGLPGLDRSLDAVTRGLLSVARAVAENVVAPEEVRAYAASISGLGDLPAGGRGEYADVKKLASTVGALDVLLDLAAEFEQAKVARGMVEYSDQVALALRILDVQPSVAEVERDRFRVVLLDEYQDTSVVQTRLLARLFGGHPVMAVGDPNQSIYGWRGASASNLDEFGRAFGGSSRYALSTSWRNGARILEAANTIVAPFSDGRVQVDRLEARPGASELPIDVCFAESVIEEADAAAEWLRARIMERPTSSAAMLFRTRASQRFFLAALRKRGIPYHVLGIGGLLAEPEIADLVSALSVVHDPSAGLQLVRLLAGSRWRLGVQDLEALRGVASWLRDRDHAQRRYDDEVVTALKNSVAEGEGGSIVDALDFVGTAKPGHSQLETFSAVGLERLRDAARVFSRLRARAGLDLPEFVAVVLQEFQLDIEVAANEVRTQGPAAIDAFFDAVTNYLALDDVATLGGFLSWLREAELREDLSPRPEPPQPGTVQILTIHGSKGLEWDSVVVPRLVDKELPGTPAEGGYQGWLGFGQLPWPFRGDAAELPEFEWQAATTRAEVVSAVSDFKARVRAHLLDEERRLAYVAVTRPRDALLLTGSFWSTQRDARMPSAYLRELEAADVIGAVPTASAFDENPLPEAVEEVTWPFDPLGERRPVVEAAATAVLAAEPSVRGYRSEEIDLLLAERRERLAGERPMAVPTRVPASRFKDFVTQPDVVATALRRPMPEKPYRATRLGTLFHSWVENRYGIGGDAQELDAANTELDLDDEVTSAELDMLRATFEASPWASRRPLEVEREIHLPFEGRIVICKIDAIYELDDGRFEVVDWKTGKAPSDSSDLDEKQLQLALYRLAYARWRGIDLDRIDAAFYYVADDRVIRPEQIDDEETLRRRWRDAMGV